MRIKNWSLLYSFSYLLMIIGTVGFFRRRKFIGKKNIPKNKPILFAPNHQSAFLDGAIMGFAVGKPVYNLGRADIFKKKVARYMLGSLNSLPVYRVRDGLDAVRKNDEAFENIYEVLKKNYPIAIYPEGNHGKYKQLRSLKKGVFKIAVGAENKYNKELDVHIVPVGINYEKHTNMGGDLFIQFGEPVRILDYIEEDPKKQAISYNVLVDVLSKRISNLMIDIQEMDYYDLIHNTMIIFDEEIGDLEGVKGKDLSNLFNRQKKYIEKIESYIESDKEQVATIQQIEEQFSKSVEKEGLKPWLFKKEHHATFISTLLLILFFPVHLYGVINNYLPYRIPALFVEKKVKDVHFHASFKLVMGALLFFVFWIVQVALVANFTENYIWILYFITLPFSALISYKYWIEFLKLKGKLRYNKLQKQQSSRLHEMKEQYSVLKEFVRKPYQK